jgi:hypothetical protein
VNQGLDLAVATGGGATGVGDSVREELTGKDGGSIEAAQTAPLELYTDNVGPIKVRI